MYQLTPEEKKIFDNAKAVLERTNGDIEKLNKRQRDVLEMYYGYAYALIMSVPGLRRAFVNAVEQGQTPEGFQVAIRKTPWFQNRNESQRKYDVASKSTFDRADFETKVNEVRDAIIRQAKADNGTTVSAADAESLANTILRDNWDDWETVLPRVVRQRFVKADALEFGGRAYGTLQDLNGYARSMGVQLSKDEAARYVEAISAETDTLDNVKATIAKNVARLYPQYADRINAGATMADIVYPYRKTMASLLEIDEESIDMYGESGKTGGFDPLLDKALMATDEKGNPLSVSQFRKMVKQDERWQFTDNARQEYASIARSLMRDFGAGV